MTLSGGIGISNYQSPSCIFVRFALGVLSYYDVIDEDVEDSMEKTSRNVEVDSDKFAILGKVILKTPCL